MKHLHDDSRTSNYLEKWAKSAGGRSSPLRTATFFFWNSGTGEQQSQSGMLRSLLFQILEQEPDLIPIVFPGQWVNQYTTGVSDPNNIMQWSRSWSIGQLVKAFKAAVMQKVIDIKLCLLIDGLDEFGGDHEALAELFHEISLWTVVNPNVKMCLASRPLVVYRESFGDGPRLHVQGHTFEDIDIYVRDRFNTNVPFQKLHGRDTETATRQSREIVDKAEGVFLWVYIVVGDLLKAVRNRDSVSDLWKRLHALPRDIEPLYTHIWSQIDPEYLIWSSKILQIVRSRLELGSTPAAKSWTGDGFTTGFTVVKDDLRAGCMSVGDIYFALEDDLNYETIKRMSQDDLVNRAEEVEFHISARCACLLEVHNANGEDRVTSRSLVKYLHRTARDYLEEETRWAQILNLTKSTAFNTHWSLMRSSSFTLHRASMDRDFFVNYPEDDDILTMAVRILVFASYADSHDVSHSEQAHILDTTAEILEKHNLPLTDWSQGLVQKGLPQEMSTAFLRVAFSLNLSGYISVKLRRLSRRDATAAKFSATYLLYLVDSSVSMSIDGLPHMSLKMARTLISKGADVNYISATPTVNKTTWQHLLERNIPEIRDSLAVHEQIHLGTATNSEIMNFMELFLSAGADPNAPVNDGTSPKGISPSQYIDKYIQPAHPLNAEKLQEMVKDSIRMAKSSTRRSIFRARLRR